MNISNATSSTSSTQINSQDLIAKQKQDFQALSQALQSGDLSAAQSVFATYLQDIKNLAPGQNQTGQNNPNNQITQDFQTLTNALQSGDLTAAQKAFQALQQDLQSLAKTRKGHHHHHPQNDALNNNAQTTNGVSTLDVSSDSTNNNNSSAQGPGGLVNEQA